MTSALTAALLAAAVGPLVLVLAHRSTHTPSAPGSVEIGAVTVVAGLSVAQVVAQPPEDALGLMPLAVLGCAAAAVDAREGRLPDALTGPLAAATLLGVLIAGGSVVNAVLGAATGTAVAIALKLLADAAIGWGDVKLAPTLGAVLTHHHVVVTGVITIALLVATTAVITGALNGRAGLVPYGPALVFGTLGAVGG